MENNFTSFRKFPTAGQAEEFAALLNAHNIQTRLADNLPYFDASFAGNTFQNQYEVQIDPSNFESAEKILTVHAEESVRR